MSPAPSDDRQKAEPASVETGRIPFRRLLIGLLAAICVVTILSFAADLRDLADALDTFTWWLAVPVLALSLWNYAFRFLKWEFFLRTVGVTRLDRSQSLRIFLSGFAMVITPGKVGEFIKAYYVQRATRFPANRVASVVTAERATDGIALALLAVIGSSRYAYGRGLLIVVFLGAAVVIALLRNPQVVLSRIGWLESLPGVRRLIPHLGAFLDASSLLVRLPVLARSVLLSLVSWSGECLAFYLILVGLGVSSSWETLLLATFILGVSSIAGGISLLPGGLGVTDATVAGMLLLFVDDDVMTKSVAVAATLLIRFATLWFAVIIGAISLWSIEREGRSVSLHRPG